MVRNLIYSFSILVLIHAPFAIASPIVGKAPQAVEDRFVRDGEGIRVETWIKDLEIPWSLVFLPEDKALVSERPGRIRLIRDGKLQPAPYAVLDAAHTGEAGLMGLAVHPAFPERPYIYAMHSYKKEGKL